MNLFMKKTSAMFFAMLFVVTVFSQNKLWEVDLKEALYEVGWIKQSNEGFIIASGAKGLLAMNNENGEIVWQNEELKAVDKNTYMNIDGLPIIYIEYSPIVGKTRGLLINSSTGNILYDTKDDEVRIKDFTLFPDKGYILFELLKGNERKVMCFSLKTLKKDWIADFGESKSFISKLTKATFVNHGPFFYKENLILGIENMIFSVNSANGEIIWKYEADKKINALVFSEESNNLYVGIKKTKKLKVLDPNNGKDITPGKLKLKGTLVDIRPDNENNLILVESEGFNIIDPKTNNFKWKKSFKLDGLGEVIAHDKGYIAIGKYEKKGQVALVDNAGKKIWIKEILGYPYYVTATSKGVLYISTIRSNILGFEKGKDVWKKDVKFRAIPAVTYDEKEDKVMLFENKKAYKFDLETGEIILFADDVELDHVKKKTPLVAEFIAGEGYLINTAQHLSLLSPSGELKFTKYFEPASDLNGFRQMAQMGLNVAGVDFDIDGALKNITTLSNLSNGVYQETVDQSDGVSEVSMVAGLSTGNDEVGRVTIFEITKERFSNSKSFKNHKFIVTKVKNQGAPNQHFIYKVNKITGEIDIQIELLDKTPDYVIDEVENVVIVNENNHLISAYKF